MLTEENMELLRRLEHLLSAQQSRPMNLTEVAEYLSVSKQCIYNLSSRGEIPHYKPNGKRLYFRKSEIDAWWSRRRIE
jgi:excisionase family DNA binding protein